MPARCKTIRHIGALESGMVTRSQSWGCRGYFLCSEKDYEGGCQDTWRHREVLTDQKKKKAGGLLRHSIYSLKKVARLPSKDRREVLNVLKKNVRRRRGRKGVNRSSEMFHQSLAGENSSSASVNNDWKN
ncbi:hypothetical protein A2U01_0033504 [Trifolium medium]|uniref:Uncharacterized protein n=1 Tax=Trifolium medium TaxID=97028 RepID=A0A392PLR9_9FABA|nr:hypothetical protein [Trifolium medium]